MDSGAYAEVTRNMDLEGLVADARARSPQPMPARERLYAGCSAALLIGVVALVGSAVPHGQPLRPELLVLAVGLYALSFRCMFEIGQNVAHPTQIAFIPMLFAAPPALVPLFVALAALLADAPDFLLKRRHPDRWLHSLTHAWYSVAPAVIIAIWAPGEPRAGAVLVYAIALAAACAVASAEATLGDKIIFNIPAGDSIRGAGFACWIDTLFTPIAYMIAAAALQEPLVLLGAAPLFWVLRTFSQERMERLAAAHELNQTYRGTVMVLADVVEADDDYTASHCRSVVELCAAAGAEIGLDNAEMQELEIAALLHDVGKIAIPDAILNKPSRLTEEEFELMKTHTIEGQALLERVGGKLAKVGEIVRSCHERWDGRGYPDGLMGEEIPLAARIVFCCDAYSAMTTDRPYRRAMNHEAAIAELRDNAGSQFEPRIVDAVVTAVEKGLVDTTEAYSDAVRAVLATHPPASASLEPAA
jgi:HD-GYP domain-containing protein (c-di-GMP phosphodiesterase class II)